MIFLYFTTITQATMLLVIFLTATVYVLFKNSFRYWKKRRVYTPKPTFPLGNFPWKLFGWFGGGYTFEETYKAIKMQSKPYGGYYFLMKPFLVPVDLEVIKRVLVTDFDYFTDRVCVTQKSEPFSKNLFELPGSEWKKIRAKLSPAFTPAKTKLVFSNVVESAEDLAQAINKQVAEDNTIELKEIIINFSTDVIVKTIFGIKSTALKDRKSKFKENANKLFETSIKGTIIRLLTLLYPQVLAFFKVPTVRKDVTTFFIKVTEDVINMRENHSVVKNDLMQLLLQIRGNVEHDKHTYVKSVDEKKMSLSLSISDIAAHCLVFFIGGYETTSTTLSLCLFELCLNKNIQEKARKEVNNWLKTTNQKFTYDVLQNMTYLERCIKETLRKYPPSPLHFRTCTKTYKMPETDLVIEKGTGIIIPTMAIHYDPDYYVNPQEFEPDRFLDGTPSAWIPFGIGPRNCIGLHFGLNEVKLGLAMMLKAYRFSLHPKTEVPLRFDFRTVVLRSIGGIWVNVEKI